MTDKILVNKLNSASTNTIIDSEATGISGSNLTLLGYQSGLQISTASSSVGVGALSLGQASATPCTFINSTAIGCGALRRLTSGGANFAGGSSVAENLDVGANNVICGANVPALVSASHNCIYGVGAGILCNSNGNCLYGRNSGVSLVTGLYNSLYGWASDCASGVRDTTCIGSNTSCTANYSSAIGTGAVCSVAQNISIGSTSITAIKGQVAFTTYSDARFKKNIEPLPLGLAFINSLEPKRYSTYCCKIREHISPKQDKIDKVLNSTDTDEEKAERLMAIEDEYSPEQFHCSNAKVWAGLLAQDVQANLEALGLGEIGIVDIPEDATKQTYGIRYEQLVPVLINAVKELTARVEALTLRIKALGA